jgi:hypothetical protein
MRCIASTKVSAAVCPSYIYDAQFLKVKWGVTHITTTPYYPRGSSAERVIRNLKYDIKIFHHNSQDTWDRDLPWLSLAFNTALHESTGCTSDKLFLGREIRSPLEIRWDLSPLGGEGTVGGDKLFWTRAYESLKKAREKVAKRYNENRKPHNFAVGDTVVHRLVTISSKANNISEKLALKWSKPVVIARVVRPNVFLVANPETGVVTRRVHVSQIKKFVQ